MADVKRCTASPIDDFEGFLHIFYCHIKNFTESLARNYFIKLVDRDECKIIRTRLTMFCHRIVEFLHKCTCQICSLLAFGELASSGFFHCICRNSKWWQLHFPHSWLITGFVTRVTWWVPLVEQDLLILPEHPSSPQVLSGVHVARSLISV